MSVGALFLCFGAEVLAMVQWIVATLCGVSLLFFSSMYGELGRPKLTEPGISEEILKRRNSFDLAQAIMVGVALTAVLGAALSRFSPGFGVTLQSGQDIQALGQLLTERHSISLDLLGITLLMVLVGGGVLSRPEASS
jgi:NADH:ubiquinone oxidoreductase subunit 6 (subunit J)